MAFDKELLFKERLPEAEVEVPNVGTIRVRALSRDEALKVRSSADVATIERRMIAAACLDPVLTVDEVKRWQLASPAGELEPITEKITELSGMTDGAAKEAYLEFEQNPDAEFRVLPSGEAGDDSDGAEG
jgi:hypothetical protein